MRLTLLLVLLGLTAQLNAQDTLKILAYNILNYPASNSTKADTLKPIIQHTKPDIFMITELTASTGVNTILNTALNVDGITHYQASTYFNGPDTDNLLYYNSDKLTLYSQYEIPTTLRNISEYVLYYNNPNWVQDPDTIFIYCYMAHLKASQGASNEQQRNQEAVSLKNRLSSRTNLMNVIVGGDFNIYTSAEAAYNTLLNGGSVQLYDPINSPGSWNSNPSYAAIHTQSTRTANLGDGGSIGGMDDRFDMILVNNDLNNGLKGLRYVNNSYRAVGNDANHYNSSIVAAPLNTSEPANVIDALYLMSDHLPVYMETYVNLNVGVNENEQKAHWRGYMKHGNFVFEAMNKQQSLSVEVYDVVGKQVVSATHQSTNRFSTSLSSFGKGVYFVKVKGLKHEEIFKVINH